jgi:hypothetical protein
MGIAAVYSVEAPRVPTTPSNRRYHSLQEIQNRASMSSTQRLRRASLHSPSDCVKKGADTAGMQAMFERYADQRLKDAGCAWIDGVSGTSHHSIPAPHA